MDNHPNIVFVNAHPEGGGRHDNIHSTFLVHKGIHDLNFIGTIHFPMKSLGIIALFS